MNKYVFWVLTLLFSLVLLFGNDYINATYLLSDKYVETDMVKNSYNQGYMSIAEYKESISNADVIEVENQPIEFQVLYFKYYVTGIVIIVFLLLITVALEIIIKSKRIKLDVFKFNGDEKKMNILRIILYMLTIMTSTMTFNIYPLNYFLGWVQTFIWIITWFLVIAWALNIIYAIRDNRLTRKEKKIKT